MGKILYMLLLLFALSCNKAGESNTTNTPVKDSVPAAQVEKKFEMYSLSEMSMLMEQMYVDNERLRDRILKGDTVGKFPNHFMGIHKAALTDEKENDAFFKKQAAIFIAAQQKIYEDPKNAKTHFNNSVNACIACHEVKCGGPITRIRKLYIK